MIPLKDYNPTRRFPYLCVALIVLNVLVFLFDWATGHYETMVVETSRGLLPTRQFVGGLSASLALVPAELTTHPLLAWPTIFSSMFLHGNWLHIGSNDLDLRPCLETNVDIVRTAE